MTGNESIKKIIIKTLEIHNLDGDAERDFMALSGWDSLDLAEFIVALEKQYLITVNHNQLKPGFSINDFLNVCELSQEAK